MLLPALAMAALCAAAPARADSEENCTQAQKGTLEGKYKQYSTLELIPGKDEATLDVPYSRDRIKGIYAWACDLSQSPEVDIVDMQAVVVRRRGDLADYFLLKVLVYLD